jgi:thioesterase domain-containing protein
MTGLELRDRLDAYTGLALPTTVIFDAPTPLLLADLVLGELADTPAAPAAGGAIASLYRAACADGKIVEGMELVYAAAKLRPSFDVTGIADNIPDPVRLAEGDTSITLVCLPAVAATAGPHQYARLAAPFRGERRVDVLPLPGFVTGEKVPADLATLVRSQAAAVRRHSGGNPVVLLGHSAGAWVALAVARQLQDEGTTPAGVVLVDPFAPNAVVSQEEQFGMVGMMFEKEQEFGATFIDDVRLTAMGCYQRMFDGWTAPATAAPVLYVRAEDPMPGQHRPQADEVRSAWPSIHTMTDVAGNHFTMMEAHADTTADAVRVWLDGLAPVATVAKEN